MTAKATVDDIDIPEEEWSMLVNAVAEPVKQMIAIEAKNAAQFAEVEHRLQNLAGTRLVLPPAVSPGEESPEAVWKRCAQQLTSSPMAALPLLIVSVNAWPEDMQQRRQLAEFWRGMNQLRENWHELPAQVIFLLSPAAYEHLTLNADHLKRWISLKLRLWPGSTDLAVLARPGKPLRRAPGNLQALLRAAEKLPNDQLKAALEAAERLPHDRLMAAIKAAESFPNDQLKAAMEASSFPQMPDDPYMRINRLHILADQAKRVYRTQSENPVELVRRYYLPLISGYLALGYREEAMFWRKKIKNKWVLDEQENRVLRNLDFKLKASDYCYDVSLSYNRKDLHSVSELSKYLQKQGLSVWLSDDEPLSGLPWQDLLEIGFRESRSVAVLIGQDGLGPWEDTEVRSALVQAVKHNRPVIPVLLPDAPSVPHLPFFLADRTWVDLRPAITKENLGRLVWGITGKKPD